MSAAVDLVERALQALFALEREFGTRALELAVDQLYADGGYRARARGACPEKFEKLRKIAAAGGIVLPEEPVAPPLPPRGNRDATGCDQAAG